MNNIARHDASVARLVTQSVALEFIKCNCYIWFPAFSLIAFLLFFIESLKSDKLNIRISIRGEQGVQI